MSDTRRDFLKKAAMLSGAASISQLLPESIQRALAINPAEGSTWRDAEHIVILMQENRSFNHALGTLRGVRGYNDPRIIKLPIVISSGCKATKKGKPMFLFVSTSK